MVVNRMHPVAPSSALPAGTEKGSAAAAVAETGVGKAAFSAPLVEASPLYARNAPPPYPRLARERGWAGEVLLRVAVTDGGRVRAVEVERSSGYALLDTAARKAVRRWHFRPSRRGERPVAAVVRVPVRFELRGS